LRTRIHTLITGHALGVCLGLIVTLTPLASQAASVVMNSPVGEVGQARQIVVRFDQAVIPLGDPRQEAPYTVDCQGAAPKGQGRWLNERTWGHDFDRDLGPGVKCQVQPRKSWQPTVAAAGKWVAPKAFAFQTGGPTITSSWPREGEQVEEEQHWVLQLSGPAQLASVQKHLRCSVQGLGEAMPVEIITGKDRQAVAKSQNLKDSANDWLLVRCQRPLPSAAKVRLSWGAGIAALSLPEAVTRQPQHLDFEVRPAFTAEFSCERERAKGPCLPLRPMTVIFSSPVPRDLAAKVRIEPDKGSDLAPFFDKDDKSEEISVLSFNPPLPESMALKVTLPGKLKDITGRTLANANMFPLGVRTGGKPPLAKFATAPFGVIELNAEPGQPPMLPLTVRNVEAQLKVLGLNPAAPKGSKPQGMKGQTRTLSTDPEIMRWMAQVQKYHESYFTPQELKLPESQWYEWAEVPQEDGSTKREKVMRNVGARELSLLKTEKAAKALQLPPSDEKDNRPFEVVGLPLPGPGYHVVEIESPRLGESLLAKAAPMYVRTGVLATNLGVHIKHGRDSSAVWVTTLDKALPVEGAEIQISECHGKPLWQGKTNAQGIARINQPLSTNADSHCLGESGLFVSARKVLEQGPFKGQRDIAFAWSTWQKGIETWRFNQPTASNQGGDDDSELRMHTVTDRALFRAGETVSMKHFIRQEVLKGLAQAKPEQWPTTLKIVHQGSGDEFTQPLSWRSGSAALGSALSTWKIPAEAKLGVYEINLIRKDARGEWPVTSGRFRVEAFRLPMVKARLSPPKGLQVSPKELPISVQLDYLSGGAFSQASARMSAVLRERWVHFDAYDEFSFSPPSQASSNQESSAEPSPDEGEGQMDQGDDHRNVGGRLIADGIALVTDRQGAAKVVLPKLPAIQQPMSVRAELSFNDPNGEVQTAATEVPLWPSEVLVGIKAGSWASNKGQVKFQALAVDTNGKPLKGQAITVQARLTQHISTRKRIVGGFYSYDNRTELKDLGKVCSGKTDDRGLLLCETTIDEAGQVELIAQSKDAQGHATQAATSVWITKQGELWFSQDNDDRMDVLPEKKQYEPGETARLQVRMPFREATVLVSVEREGVISTQVMTLKGDDPTIELPIPKTESWAPNVFVSVMAVRGRINEVPWYSFFTWGWRTPAKWWQAFRGDGREYEAPTALVDLSRPAFKLGVAQLKIGRAVHELKVEVLPVKDKFGTRDTARTRVRVTQNGQPVQGEVAFAAVDEALLSLADNDSWQLLDGLLKERSWRVETGTAQNEIVGRRHYGRKAVAAGGGGGGSNTRELFDTLLLWRGDVALNAQGEAVLDVPLNDSLTSFRLVAIANGVPKGPANPSEQEAFGMGSASIRVTQDLQMLPGLPPLVREGDQFEALFTLRNTTATPLKVHAELQGTATPDVGDGLPPPPAAELKLAPQDVTVPADGAVEVRWPINVPLQTKALQWQASVVSSTAVVGASRPPQDRVKVEQKVQTAVPIRVWAATLQQLEGTASVPVAAPVDATTWATAQGIRPRGGVLIGVQPRLTSALPGIRRYFEHYPFVCLEQKTSKAVGLKDAALWAEVSKTLPSYLDADGLAHYFPPSNGDAHRGYDTLTAYVLSATHEAGFELPEQAREAMLGGLSLFVQGKLQREAWVPSNIAPGMGLTVRKLAALAALARHGRAEARMLDSLTLEPQRWPTAAVIDWLRVLQALPAAAQREARMSEAENVLRSRLTYAGTTLKFSTEADDFWWWFMDSADANAAKLVLAVLDRPSWKEDLPRLVVGALGRQRQGAWMTTTANLWGSLALDKFSQRFESVPLSGQTQASLGGSTSQLAWGSQPEGGKLSLPWPVLAAGGKAAPAGAPLQVQQVGTGKPWLTVQALVAVPLKAPLSAGYRLQREVKLVDGDTLKPLPAGPLPRGSVLRVSLTIDAQSDMTWVALTDPIPGGANVLGSGLGNDSEIATGGERAGLWPLYVERSFEAWRGYFQWVPKGQHKVEYTVRLNNPGRFQMPPSRIEAMYSPETFGELPNAVVEVKP
jgi:uncharacterized protein YfaS (alpha-2-macroglobulin family)